jgi:hypothetical protein
MRILATILAFTFLFSASCAQSSPIPGSGKQGQAIPEDMPTPGPEAARRMVVISDEKKWHQPDMLSALRDAKLTFKRVELYGNGYMVVIADFPWDSRTMPNSHLLTSVEYNLLAANHRKKMALQDDTLHIRYELSPYGKTGIREIPCELE